MSAFDSMEEGFQKDSAAAKKAVGATTSAVTTWGETKKSRADVIREKMGYLPLLPVDSTDKAIQLGGGSWTVSFDPQKLAEEKEHKTPIVLTYTGPLSNADNTQQNVLAAAGKLANLMSKR